MADKFKGFFNCSTKEELLQFQSELWADYDEECRNLLKRCQRFVSGCYLFDNEWDMEKTQVPVYWTIDEINWRESPNGDLEWNYMLNRQRFLVDIALAYLLTNESCYQRYLERFLEAFLKDNPLNKETEKVSWRTIDVGLRLVNWLKIFEVHRFVPIFSDSIFAKLEKEMVTQAEYLYENLSIERGQSNWQVIEIAGLYAVSQAFTHLPQSHKWQEASLFYLEESLRLQVEEDGLQREQSFTYHNEVLLCVLQVIQLTQRANKEVPAAILIYAEKLIGAASLFVKPDGQQPAFGDSDKEEMTGLLQYAEALLTKATTKTMAPNFFAKCSLGKGLFYVTNQFLIQKATYHFPQAGIMIAKNPKSYHLFKCGPLGGGHGHDDLLHFEYAYEGKELVVDSGRYSYEVSKKRLAFKAAKAHNTIVVDNQNFHQHTDALGSQRVATPLNQKLVEKQGIQLFEGGHLGYFHLSDPVYVNRKLLHFPEGFSVISDSYLCQKAHEIQTFYHFHSMDVQIKRQSFYSSELDFELFSLDEASRLEVEETVISPEYNALQPIKCGIVKRAIQGTSVSTYVMSPQNTVKKIERVPVYSDHLKLDNHVVEALRIHLKNGQQMLVIIQHLEPNNGRRAYQVEGNYYYGRVMIITENKTIVLD
ncbi:hypothetical protein IGI37_003284 [Enterococcus sp. AZ194]|uniref:alginate lyase family protein n=1 Tax=Enterococcus sp. AZ194 TaxID=2774629 RepID=UPI003F1F666B